MAEHSPLPWRAGYWGGQCHIAEHAGNHPGAPHCKYDPEFNAMEPNGTFAGICTDDGREVIGTRYDELSVSYADAAFLVRCVNSHDELLAALTLMDCPVCDCSIGHPMRVTDRCSFCAAARAAVAKAKG